MPDYSQHRLQDWAWYFDYRSQMGKEKFYRYINRVYRLLMSMKPGSYLSIEKNVKPENIDLFIKTVCMFISEQQNLKQSKTTCIEFNDSYTEIKCNSL